MGKDSPPPYSEHLTRTSTNVPAYAIAPPLINPHTLLPSTFRVGQYDVSPFVTVPEMKLHLKLLAAFDALQQRVRETPEAEGNILDGDTRWSVFCTRAEKNFEAWVRRLPEGTVRLEDEDVPGLDVVMCWHAYMLNPRRWYEDCERDERIERVGRLGKFPLEQVVSSAPSSRYLDFGLISEQTTFIDPTTFEYNPPRREKSPAARDTLPFPTSPETTTFPLYCPQCMVPNIIPWLKSPDRPHGYCQKEFQHACVGCGLIITHDVLRVNKVCEDIVGVYHGDVVKFLPGLGLMPSTGDMTPFVGLRVSSAIAAVFKLAFDNAFPDKTRLQDKSGQTFTASALGQHVFHWSFAEFEKMLDRALKSGVIARAATGVMFKRCAVNLRIGRMYASYAHAGLASVALGPAVMRQANFIGKMKGLGWLKSGRFEGEPFLLQKSAARYHAFLDLMRSMQGFLCPSESRSGFG